MISLKLDTLLKGKVVEQNRVEYKKGWNPADIIHTICAFANDYSNVNGGYIVIGIEADNGIPILPPAGLNPDHLDFIQQEIFQYCNKIFPRYIPKIEVVNYHDEGIWLLYLWCSAGDSGPYKAPRDVYSGRNLEYWIRPSSITTTAKDEELVELFDKFNSPPFDDRVNRKATISDIRRGYLEDFLRESNSSLAYEINHLSLKELLIALEVANETDVDLTIRNIGLMMFADRPDKFIPGAHINLVHFHNQEAEGSDEFTEKTFVGPIWKQIRDALDYINVNVIKEKVVKVKNKAEAIRFYNYPYNALEELLVNSVFHKSYHDPEPVEIRIYMDYIQIINYPGPAKWIDMEKFKKGNVRARKYRNRRIGEFLKEIDLSEKQSTGITKVLNELRRNESPYPTFETDQDRTYLITTLKARKGFDSVKNETQKLKSETQKLKSETQESKNETQKLENETQELENETQKLENETQELENETQKLKNETQESKNETQKLENETQKFEDETLELVDDLKIIVDKIINDFGEKSNPTINLLINYICEMKQFTSLDVQNYLNKSKSTVIRYLNKLIEKDIIVKEGEYKRIIYKLNTDKFSNKE